MTANYDGETPAERDARNEKVLVELIADEVGITPAEWWHGFCQRYATHP